MSIRRISFLALLLLAATAVCADDLYLLRIDSKEALEYSRQIAGNAYGTINSRFLVALSDADARSLQSLGVPLELVSRNFDPDRYYLIVPVNPLEFRKVLPFISLYAEENYYIIKATASEAERVRLSGFMPVPLAGRTTPLFYKPREVTAFKPLDSYPYDTLAPYILQDSLYSYNTRLEAFRTRYVDSDSILAAEDWLYDKFLSFGYTQVSKELFYLPGVACNNIVCVKPGTTEPDNVVVIGGHFDSYNQQSNPSVYAPGADDNASGTSAVLELARVLRNVPLNKTLIFIAFSAEEVGLVGSHVAAQNFYSQGTNIEYMLNFDMIGYTDDAVNDVVLFSGPFTAYAALMASAAARVTTLIPYYGGSAGNSDHASFVDFGYHAVYAQEGDFNFPGWHTDIDLTSRMNFSHMTEIVRMAIAGIGQADIAASPTFIDRVYDVGDGQSLQINWSSNCRPDYTYKIVYGAESGIYTDTIAVSPPNCTYTINGLQPGITYYLAVLGENAQGHGPIYLPEDSGVSYVEPRAPRGFVVEPDSARIELTWRSNSELDLDHYKILRRESGGAWQTLVPSLTDTFYIDYAVLGHTMYEYTILAVDNLNNESDSAQVSGTVPATFDGGILFVEETAAGGLNPTELKQAAYYDSVFAGIINTKHQIGPTNQYLTRSLAGQYSSVLWFDDDISSHLFDVSLDSMRWYLGYATNLMLAGFQSVYWLSGNALQGPGDFVYDEFGITRVTENSALDFVGAIGVNGWPSLSLKTGSPFNGVLPSVSVFETLPGATPIYNYDSQSNNPLYEGKTAGVIYNSASGKRIALSFPIYYLTASSAQSLMAKVIMEFGEESGRPFGDVNGNGIVNILDVVALISYLYKSGPAPDDLNYADPNGNCVINILDITYLVAYLYKGGPAPVAGCVE
jgi:hypothetical protein